MLGHNATCHVGQACRLCLQGVAIILLNEPDHELAGRGHRFTRYADDMVVLVKSPRAGDRVMQNLTRYLEGRLKLKISSSTAKPVAKDWPRIQLSVLPCVVWQI